MWHTKYLAVVHALLGDPEDGAEVLDVVLDHLLVTYGKENYSHIVGGLRPLK